MKQKNAEISTLTLLELRPNWGLGRLVWVFIISLLFALTTIGHFLEFKAFGNMAGYPPSVSILFAPIYEEIIFRAVLLSTFTRLYGVFRAALITFLLFGLWHLKNIFWLDPRALIYQMGYTSLVFGPIAVWITWKAECVWPVVALHYINNFSSPLKGWMTLLH